METWKNWVIKRLANWKSQPGNQAVNPFRKKPISNPIISRNRWNLKEESITSVKWDHGSRTLIKRKGFLPANTKLSTTRDDCEFKTLPKIHCCLCLQDYLCDLVHIQENVLVRNLKRETRLIYNIVQFCADGFNWGELCLSSTPCQR